MQSILVLLFAAVTQGCFVPIGYASPRKGTVQIRIANITKCPSPFKANLSVPIQDEVLSWLVTPDPEKYLISLNCTASNNTNLCNQFVSKLMLNINSMYTITYNLSATPTQTMLYQLYIINESFLLYLIGVLACVAAIVGVLFCLFCRCCFFMNITSCCRFGKKAIAARMK